MKQSQVQKLALALPETTEEPHFDRTSFRIYGKVFATAFANESSLNVMVGDAVREPALSIYADCVEPLFWGKKVLGLRVNLLKATPTIVAELLEQAWCGKAPRALVEKYRGRAN